MNKVADIPNPEPPCICLELVRGQNCGKDEYRCRLCGTLFTSNEAADFGIEKVQGYIKRIHVYFGLFLAEGLDKEQKEGEHMDETIYRIFRELRHRHRIGNG